MTKQNNWKGLIRALTYTIIFEPNPLDKVDETIKHTIDGHVLGASPQEYLDAIGTALGSNETLADINDNPQSEQVIRSYLGEIRRSLEEKIKENRIDANAKWKDDVRRLLFSLESPLAHISESPEDIDVIINHEVVPVMEYHTPQQYIESIRIGLASDKKLSGFISKRYSEESIRAYLRKIQQRLEERFVDRA